ncbi:DUF92 domain-containing protein [Clostridium hydrogeniformans]|uniref:DUF92 domain-containing protein n=1 Tax=Clostridium hydrogeniformans TaxID=349933 RepID=UPI00048590DD|nr:DUF92 domain-containing protein [Clostridium hydrogeniformans]
METLIGCIISIVIAGLAFSKKSLNLSGFIGAVILGSLIYTFGGASFYSIMMVFFISSSLLTKIKKENKLEDNYEKDKKGRNYIQVLANGGIGLILSYMFYKTNNNIYYLIYCISFATANADTWASEVGVLSKRSPISLITFKRIKRGESGGVSLLGTLASFMGSSLIGIFFVIGYLNIGTEEKLVCYFILCIALGFLGSIIDSILGETIQVKYKNSKGDIVEIYSKENQLIRVKGIPGVNNDVVNLLSNIIVVGISFALIF